MPKPARHFAIRSKIWIEDAQGQVAFGLGRYRILKGVQRTGSLHAAAKELKMSYRAVWMRIRASEESIGQPLVVREGKGSRLTAYAETLVQHFESLQAKINGESDAMFAGFLSDQLP
jgi:molybdate transport system regulatory protein